MPTQSFQYLGLVWDTIAWQVSIKKEREEKIRNNAQQLLIATCRVIATFLGRTNSAIGAIPLARARTRVLQWEFLSVCTSEDMYDEYMQISDRVKNELHFWAHLPEGLSSPITLPEASASLATDASETGLGILFNGHLVSEPVPEEFMDSHINVKELLTLSKFLDLFPYVSDTTITWRVDNNSALAAIRNQGSTQSWPLCSLSCSIWERCLARNILLDPVRVSSEENLVADAASRFRHVADWSLDTTVARKVFARWGVPDVDLMASNMSRKCPLFFSWSRADTEVCTRLLPTLPYIVILLGLGTRQSGQRCGLESLPEPVLFPSFPTPPTGTGQDIKAENRENDTNSTMVVRETFLSVHAEYDSRSSEDSGVQQADHRHGDRITTSRYETSQASRRNCFWDMRRPYKDLLSSTAAELVEASWRQPTEKSYGSAWSKWVEWCAEHELSPYSPSLSSILNYLSQMYDNGAQYRTINLHRSALSSTLLPIEGSSVGKHPLVCRLLKGVYNKRPPRPKLFPSWSVDKMLETLKKEMVTS